MNTSATAGFLYFTPKNYAGYSILDRVIINNSILNAIPVLNITVVSENATNCTFNYDAAGEQSALMSQSPDRGFWTNASALSWTDTTFDTWDNITYNCTDSAGNYSGSGLLFFKLDTAAPTFPATPTFSSISNKSTGGNYLTVTINTTDANPSYCGLSLYYGSGTRRNISSEVSFNSTLNNALCYVNVTPSDIVEDGYVEIVPFVKDNAGNENTSTTNQSYIVYRLKTGWNIITGYQNKTLSQIAAEFTNVTYVSVFDNRGNMKNFTTFTVGGATNANTGANFSSDYSSGAAYVYVNSDVVSIRRYYSPPSSWQSVNLYHNTSASKPTWNLIGVTAQLTNLNSTIMQNVCGNYTLGTTTNETVNFTANDTWVALTNSLVLSASAVMNESVSIPAGNWTTNATHIKLVDTVGDVDPLLDYNVTYTYTGAYSYANCANVTWVSFYSIQDGKFCSFYRNRLATSCSLTSAQYNLTRGDALWIATQPGVNITLARGSWS